MLYGIMVTISKGYSTSSESSVCTYAGLLSLKSTRWGILKMGLHATASLEYRYRIQITNTQIDRYVDIKI